MLTIAPYEGLTLTSRRDVLVAALTLMMVLLGAAKASADAVERVANGGFELGAASAAPPWTFADAGPCSAAFCGQSAAGGSRYASSGLTFEQIPAGTTNNQIGSFRQSIVIAQEPAKLSFALRYVDSPDPSATELIVRLGDVQLAHISDLSPAFQQITLPIPPGQVQVFAQTLEFAVSCSNFSAAPIECDRIDVDDVSVITGSPPDAPPIVGTTPAPANATPPSVMGTPGAGVPSSIRTFGVTTRVTLRLAKPRVASNGRLTIAVSNANAFAVTGKLNARPFTVGARGTRRVRLTLPRAARARLRRTGRVSVRLTAVVTDPAGRTRTVRKTVSPRSRRP